MRTAEELNASWRQDERWAGIIRPYRAEDVVRLRGSIGIERALVREDEKRTAAGGSNVNWFAPIVADGEAGFGGPLNAFELTKALIEAGASAVHFEDQLASAKKCGHLGGKVLVSTGVFLQKLVAARIASDLCDVPTILIARTDANSAKLITTDVDPRDQPFIMDAERTTEGFHRFRGGIDASIARGLPCAELFHVQPRGGLSEKRPDRLCRAPGRRVRRQSGGLPRVRASDVRRDRVLRRNRAGDHGWRCVDSRDGRFHAEGAIPRSRREGRTGRIASAPTERHRDRLGIGRSEGQLAQTDREREECFLPSEELRSL